MTLAHFRLLRGKQGIIPFSSTSIPGHLAREDGHLPCYVELLKVWWPTAIFYKSRDGPLYDPFMDEKGKVVGHTVRWVIGGTKDKPALAPDAETVFNFVVETEKPFVTKTVSFTRLILEGGKVADVNQNVLMVMK